MNNDFYITSIYIRNLEYQAHESNEMFNGDECYSNFIGKKEVQYTKVEDADSKYEMDVQFDVTAYCDDKPVITFIVRYLAVVFIIDAGNLDDAAIKNILENEAPRKMYDMARYTIKSVSLSSGFPTIAEDDPKLKCALDKKEDPDEENRRWIESITVPLGYDWIVKYFCASEEGRAFWDVYRKALVSPVDRYQDAPIYKYFLRFLDPIEYNHPDYDGCDEGFWDMLFQFLFAIADVKIVEGSNDLPELEFTYCQHERQTVSALSLFDVKELIGNLAIEAFTDISVELMGTMSDEKYANSLRNNQMLLREEVMKMFGCDFIKSSGKDLLFVNNIYRRICDCKIQTLPYIL